MAIYSNLERIIPAKTLSQRVEVNLGLVVLIMSLDLTLEMSTKNS